MSMSKWKSWWYYLSNLLQEVCVMEKENCVVDTAMDRNSSPLFVMDCNKKTSNYLAGDLSSEDAVSLHSCDSFESLYDESATADV